MARKWKNQISSSKNFKLQGTQHKRFYFYDYKIVINKVSSIKVKQDARFYNNIFLHVYKIRYLLC